MGIPIMLDVRDKKVLIVGGGNIGYRKACTFVKHHADVMCVSLRFNKKFDTLNTVKKIEAGYNEAMLYGKDFVIAATDDSDLNGVIYNQCKDEKILCMTVDYENPSDFSFMAYRDKQDLLLALSTKGKSPKFAKEMITHIMEQLDESYFEQLKHDSDERERRIKSKIKNIE